MNSIIQMIGALVLSGGMAVAAAGGDGAERGEGPSTPVQKAVNACADAFLAKIAPGQSFGTRLIANATNTAPMSTLAPEHDRKLEVSMEARGNDRSLLATSVCTVDFQAKVSNLYTNVRQPAVLARIAASDIHLVTQR
jgi:hypothetical protein